MVEAEYFKQETEDSIYSFIQTKEKGCSRQTIMDEMRLSISTVLKYLKSLYNKGRIGWIWAGANLRIYLPKERIPGNGDSQEIKGLILSFIQTKRKGSTINEISKDLGLLYRIVHRHLKSLIQEKQIYFIWLDGKQKLYFPRQKNERKQACSFCGSSIQGKGSIYNIFYPEIVYCTKICLDRNAPTFSLADLERLGSQIQEKRDEFSRFNISGTSDLLNQPSETHLSDREQSILAFIQTSPGCSSLEITKQLAFQNSSIGLKTVQGILHDLQLKKLISRKSHGCAGFVRFEYYSIKNAGLDILT